MMKLSHMRRRWVPLAAGALVVGLAVGTWLRNRSAFPGEQWSRKTPEQAGFSSGKLAEFSRKAGGSGCLVHGGEMIHAWGDITSRTDVASSIKPIYAFLTFKAIETGRLESLDVRVADFMPALKELNPELEFKDREITFRHLLSQTSGYGLEERPGAAFAYNDYGTGLLVWTVLHEVYRSPWKFFDQVLNGEALGQAIGFEDVPDMNHQGSHLGRIRISVRDMARFALLYLRGGTWRGQRVLRKDLFAEAMAGTLPPDLPRTSGAESRHLKRVESIGGGKNQKNHLGCLGYFWWFNRATPDGSLFLPDAPPGTFMGSGYGGRYAMIAIPEWDLVAVWHGVYRNTGESWSPLSEVGRFRVNDLLRELRAARTDPGP